MENVNRFRAENILKSIKTFIIVIAALIGGFYLLSFLFKVAIVLAVTAISLWGIRKIFLSITKKIKAVKHNSILKGRTYDATTKSKKRNTVEVEKVSIDYSVEGEVIDIEYKELN